MPRVYKRPLGSKIYRKYTQENLQEAINAIQSGSITLNAAHKKYRIPKGTLHNNKMNAGKVMKCGGQLSLTDNEEQQLCGIVLKTSFWGFPLTKDDLRYITKGYLTRIGKTVPKFSNNLPGVDWVNSFLIRHKTVLSERKCQNITPQRASVSEDIINNYFDNLETSLIGISPQNICNYDETNVSDDPGSKKCIFKKGIKYPERVMGHSKTSVSLMFCGSAVGVLLPVYTVYKGEHLWSTWAEGGPPGARFNRTAHGWFDIATFTDWFKTVYLPFARSLEGPKALIGDNLASHFSQEVVELAEQNNVCFICLPPNATHIAQPLDLAVFGPMKRVWRSILTEWKMANLGKNGIPKSEFPRLLKKLWDTIHINDAVKNNLIAGFRGAGIVPTNRNVVLKRLPSGTSAENSNSIAGNSQTEQLNESLLDYLKNIRFPRTEKKVNKRKKIRVEAGKSITTIDFPAPVSEETTSLPTNNNILAKKTNKCMAKRKKNPRVDLYPKKVNDCEPIISDSSSDYENFLSQLRQDKVDKEKEAELDTFTPVKYGDFVLVKFSTKKTQKFYVGQVLKENVDFQEHQVKFLKKEDGPNKFSWPAVEDISVVNEDDIERKLPDPICDRRECLVFPISFETYNMG